MTAKDVLLYWLAVAAEDLATAEDLIRLKRYHYSLFFCQLALEKLLKGLVYKQTKHLPLPIHHLVKLAQFAKLQLTAQQRTDLQEITTWNIQARYDNIKRDFYKKSTASFTKTWFKKVKDLYLWLKNQY